MKVFYEKAKVISLKLINSRFLELVLENSNIAYNSRPGNFVLVKGWNTLDPILARPFDIVQRQRDAGQFSLVIKIEGRGTRLIGKLKENDFVYVTGPLGKPVLDFSGKRIGLLVRGVGAAAVVLLAEEANKNGIEVYTFLSASSKDKLVCNDLLEKHSFILEIATDDGSKGFKGDARDIVKKYLKRVSFDRFYTCGSKRFARFIAELDKKNIAEGYLFLENYMACGMGDCHGCAVKKANKNGYLLVCKDGPVFRSTDVEIQ